MNDLAATVAAHGVPSRLAFPSSPLPAGEFGALLGACVEHGLLGLLGSVVGAGTLPVDDEQRAQVEAALSGWSGYELRIEQLLLHSVNALSAAGIDCRVLEGVALSRTVYPEVEQRAFGGADLLVPSGRLPDAVDVLERGLNATRAQPERHQGFDERFGAEVLLHTRHGLELGLHRVFVDGAFGRSILTDDLFAPPYRFPLAGYELATLPMPQRLLASCYAVALGDSPPRLISLRDVVQLVLREHPNLLDVLMLARSWRCEIVVAKAVTTAWDTLAVTEVPSIVTWARQFEPDKRAERLLGAHEGTGRRFARHLAALPGAGTRPMTDVGAADEGARYQRSPHALWRRTLETVVVLAVDGDEPLVLGGTGADVWMLLMEARTVEDLVEALAEHSSGESDAIVADVATILATLRAAGVVFRAAA